MQTWLLHLPRKQEAQEDLHLVTIIGEGPQEKLITTAKLFVSTATNQVITPEIVDNHEQIEMIEMCDEFVSTIDQKQGLLTMLTIFQKKKRKKITMTLKKKLKFTIMNFALDLILEDLSQRIGDLGLDQNPLKNKP